MLRSLAVGAAAIFAASACTRMRVDGNVPRYGSESIVRGEAGRRMHAYLEAAQSFGFSGAVLIADRSGIVLRNGYGQADQSRRVSPAMLFDMGSITKQFTAAAILMLEAEGRLSTNDRLSKFFPEAPPDKAGITLHQMLTHSSGIIENLAGDYDQISRDSAVRIVLSTPLVATPGASFSYSNAGFSMLAIIIEKVTGQEYERFMHERVFGPAGMRRTGYRIVNLDSPSVARTYTPPVDHGTPAERLARAGGPGWNLRGNGGLLTTVDDLYSYDQSLLQGRPVSAAVQAKQFTEQFRRSPTLAHGYDWWIEPTEDGGMHFNRGGDGPETGVSAEYRRYSRDTSVFILLANNRHHGWSTRRYVMPELRRLYVDSGSLTPPTVRGATARDLDGVVGTYAVDSVSYFRVDRIGDHLGLSALGQRAVDVMIFNRDSNSIRNRERANVRAANLVTALATQDSAAAQTAFGANVDVSRVLQVWRQASARLGAFQCVEVLGTDRLDRGVFMSTARVRFQNGSKTLRWAWSGTTPVLNSEDGRLPRTLGFGADSPVEAGAWSPYWWLTARDSMLTYDLAFNQTLVARLERSPAGVVESIVFDVPGKPVRATRVQDDQVNLSCIAK